MKRALVALLVVTPSVAWAHPVGFGVLQVEEQRANVWDVTLRVSGSFERAQRIEATLPDCEALTPIVTEIAPTGVDRRWRVRCPMVGEVGVRGLPSDLQVQLRLDRQNAPPLRELLDVRQPTLQTSDPPPSVFVGYAILGVRHILEGFDHLLFVLGLVALLWGERKRLVLAITAFTAGHSVALTLATLGWVGVATTAAEAVIALSLVLLAVETTRERSLSARAPWIVAGGFGLVHGLGFAGALAEIGLPPDDIPTALFSFNVGVEVGQLAFVAVCVAVGAVLQRGISAPRLQRGAAYVVGIAGTYWALERLALL
ncbi:MAG: HupE/UreJ family protein [Myxococcota bacterium]